MVNENPHKQDPRGVYTDDERDLIDLYYPAHRADHAYHVVAAFVLNDMEPPHGGGYDARQAAIIRKHYDKYDPNGSRAEAAKEDS